MTSHPNSVAEVAYEGGGQGQGLEVFMWQFVLSFIFTLQFHI